MHRTYRKWQVVIFNILVSNNFVLDEKYDSDHSIGRETWNEETYVELWSFEVVARIVFYMTLKVETIKCNYLLCHNKPQNFLNVDLLYESPGGNQVDGLPPVTSWTARKKRTQTRNWPTWATSARNLWIRFAIWYFSYLDMAIPDPLMLSECPGIALSPRDIQSKVGVNFYGKLKMTENDNLCY